MAFNKQRIIDEFNLKPFGSRGWMRSDKLVCPNCGQNDEFAVRFTNDGGVMHCLHSRTCNNYTTSLYSYLKHINRSDLVDFDKSISLEQFPDLSEEKEEEIKVNKSLPIKKLPIGFKRIEFDEYLQDRSFLKEHYELFKVGITTLDSRYRNQLIFQILNKKNECIGWLARSKKSKEWHKENLRLFKQGKVNLVLRYDNSPETDFSGMLGGLNEITDNTKVIIIVEGLFDKVNVDKQLNLLKQEEYKCLFSFGNTLTDDQIEILKNLKNIETIYMLYDEGTIDNSKEYGMKLVSTKKEVKVCEIKRKDLDPGEMNTMEILDVLEKSVDALSFNFNKINGI